MHRLQSCRERKAWTTFDWQVPAIAVKRQWFLRACALVSLLKVNRAEVYEGPRSADAGEISSLTSFQPHLTIATALKREGIQMKIYDVSVPLTAELPTYPGDPGIQISDWASLDKGDAANVSLLHFGAHTGTHIDAPAHFIPGAAKLESMPLEVLIGEAEVVEVPDDALLIDGQFVSKHCAFTCPRILFKTRNSKFWKDTGSGFRKDYTYLSTDGARQLVANGVRLIGIDYLSIEQFGGKTHETHLTLLSNRVIIVEGLSLDEVPSGRYELICLPLRIRGGKGDGAPARAVLRTLQ